MRKVESSAVTREFHQLSTKVKLDKRGSYLQDLGFLAQGEDHSQGSNISLGGFACICYILLHTVTFLVYYHYYF